jgi:hypothetical protein
MRTFYTILILFGFALDCLSQTNTTPQATNDIVIFRKPFTLKLPIDKEHYYEQKFEKTPYVLDGDIYLFNGDEFGVSLDVDAGIIRKVSYQKQFKKADVTFKFTQEKEKDGSIMTLLVINNHSQKKLFLDALMTIPRKERVSKTSILPVEAGLIDIESWPHPIIQLVLRNLRFDEKPVGD